MTLRPGAPPPFVMVYCSICQLPVERVALVGGREVHDRLVLSEPQSAYSMEFEAQCCGKTQGRRVGLDEMMRARVTNEKIFVVVKGGEFQGIGALRRADVAPRRKRKKAA